MTLMNLITLKTTTMTTTMVMEVKAAGMTEFEGIEEAIYLFILFNGPPVSFLPQILTEKFRRICGTRELNTNM